MSSEVTAVGFHLAGVAAQEGYEVAGVFYFANASPHVGQHVVDEVAVFNMDEVPGFKAHAAGAEASGIDDGGEVFIADAQVGVVFFGGVAGVEKVRHLLAGHAGGEVGDAGVIRQVLANIGLAGLASGVLGRVIWGGGHCYLLIRTLIPNNPHVTVPLV